MALEGFRSLLQIVGDIAEKNEEKKDAKILSAFDDMSAEYLKEYGDSAREKVKDRILSIKDINLNEQTANRVINHVANGHTSLVRELLWADLVEQGTERDQAKIKADSVYFALLLFYLLAQANANSEVITDVEKSKEALRLANHFAFPTILKQRLICPNCYRIIREWSLDTGGIEYSGPSHIKCGQCQQVIPTYLLPWNKQGVLSKILVFIAPVLLFVGGIIAIILSSKDVRCIALSGLMIIPSLIFGYLAWRKSKETLKVPTW